MKKLLIFVVCVALAVFFTFPGTIFGEPGDESNAEGTNSEEQFYMDPLDNSEGGGSHSYEDPPESLPDNDDEFLPVYCIDENIDLDGDGFDYTETSINVSDELIASGENADNAEAVEIMATTATGATDGENQHVVWALLTSLTEHEVFEYGDLSDTEKDVYDAVLKLADTYNDQLDDPGAIASLEDFLISQGINDIEVWLNPDGREFIESDGTANNEFVAVAVMPNPLVPGVTDGAEVAPVDEGKWDEQKLPPEEDGKTVFWYILEGSYNVSFAPNSLLTETTAPMFDYADDGDSMNSTDNDDDGIIKEDTYGASVVNYYFYWWGDGYPEYEEMRACLGAAVDIDDDCKVDLEKGCDLNNFKRDIDVVKDYTGKVIKTCGTVDECCMLNPVSKVETYEPCNIDIDYFNAGKMIMRYKNGQDGKSSPYHDIEIADHGWYDKYNNWQYIDYDYWVNGGPAVTIPSGYYTNDWYQEDTKNQVYTGSNNWRWKDCFIYHPEPYYQRFVIESYSEPFAMGCACYSRWLDFTVNKTDSDTDDPVEGAVYSLTYSSGRHQTTVDPSDDYPYDTYFEQTTDAIGDAVFKGLPWAVYKLMEMDPPPEGYELDETEYFVKIAGMYGDNPDDPIAGDYDEDAWGLINVQNDPIGGDGDGDGDGDITTTTTTPTVEVAGIIEVAGLAFTGINPAVPIGGIGTIIGGLGLLFVSLIRKRSK